MANEIIIHDKNIFSIDNFWDSETCEIIINQVEETNIFSIKETVLSQNSLDDNLDSRDNFVVYLNNQDLADVIYEFLQENLSIINFVGYEHIGIHSNLRVYKYLTGQEFKPHTDGHTVVSDTERSFYSLLLYLNENFKGGNTTFTSCKVKPKQGRITFFPHNFLHAGEIVEHGTKYVMRGNIVFRKKNI